MHGLETIQSFNQAQFYEHAISKHRQNGRYVVVEKHGLHIVGFATFSGPNAQDDALNHQSHCQNKSYDVTAEMLQPFVGVGFAELAIGASMLGPDSAPTPDSAAVTAPISDGKPLGCEDTSGIAAA